METETVERAADSLIEEFQIRAIPANLLPPFWSYAEPYIKRALDHMTGELFLEDVKNLCMKGVFQLWLVYKDKRVIAAVTTEIVNYPRCRRCRIITIAGSGSQNWSSAFDAILVDWAKEQNCTGIEASVRKGYVPKLLDLGYRNKSSSVLKEF